MALDYQHRKRQAAERRKKIRMKQVKEAIQCRDNHFPIAVSIIAFGLILILLRILIGVSSSEITTGQASNMGEIIGPFEIESSELQSLDIDYNLKTLGSKWCAVSVLLLDKNKNYVTGCTKDLFYERDVWGDVYEESDMEYLIEIDKPGTYYYQFITKHQNPNFRLGKIKYDLGKKSFGINYFTTFGIIILVIGIPYLIWTVMDWELTPYLPEMKSPKSKKKIKTVAIILTPIVVLLILMSVFKVGYADLQNAPSSNFDHNDTHYFGK